MSEAADHNLAIVHDAVAILAKDGRTIEVERSRGNPCGVWVWEQQGGRCLLIEDQWLDALRKSEPFPASRLSRAIDEMLRPDAERKQEDVTCHDT